MTTRRWLLPLASLLALGAVTLGCAWRRGLLRRLADGLRTFSAMQSFSAQSAQLYDALIGAPAELAFGPIAREAVSVRPRGAVLDVGCGPGRLAVQLAKLAPGLSVTGLDLAPAMVERARRRAAAAGLAERVRFVAGNVAAMPWPDAQFDLVVSTFSMHHWADVAGGLGEIHRVLKPGGRACIYDATPGALRLLRHGDSPSVEQAARWFGGEAQDRTHRLGPLPVLRRLCLTRGMG